MSPELKDSIHRAKQAWKLRHAFNQLKLIQQNHDKEEAHREADKVLCDLLTTLGYEDIVAEYQKIGKWYA